MSHLRHSAHFGASRINGFEANAYVRGPSRPDSVSRLWGHHLYSSDDVFEFEAETGKSPFHPI